MDKKKKNYFSRDRLGIKPLYYGFNNGYFSLRIKNIKNLKVNFIYLLINKHYLIYPIHILKIPKQFMKIFT